MKWRFFLEHSSSTLKSALLNLSQSMGNRFRSLVEGVVIYALLPARILLDTSSTSSLVGAIVFVLLILRLLIGKVHIKAISLTMWAFPLILLAYYCAAHFQGAYVYPIRGIIRYGTYVLLFLVFSVSTFETKKLYSVFTILVAIEIAAALVQKYFLGVARPGGTLLMSNHLAYFLSFYIGVSLFGFGKIARSLLLLCFVTLVTRSLGGTIVSVVVIGFYFFQKSPSKAVALSLLLGLIIPFVLGDRLTEQTASFEMLEEKLEADDGGNSGSLVWRIVYWTTLTKKMLDEGGGVLGMGLEYTTQGSPYAAGEFDPHNEYVRVFLESGMIGALLFLGGLTSFIRFFYLHRMSSPIASAILYSTIGLCIGMLVGNIVTQSTLLWFVAIFASISIKSVVEISMRKPLESDAPQIGDFQTSKI